MAAPRARANAGAAAALFAPAVALLSPRRAAGANPCALSIDASGAYSVSCGAWPALNSYETALALRGAWASSRNGSLVLQSSRATSGSDAWGTWSGTEQAWGTAPSGAPPAMLARFRVYDDAPAIVFEQLFPSADATPTGRSEADRDSVASAFPSFALPAAGGPLAFMEFAGAFVNRGLGGPVFAPFDNKAGAAAYASGLDSGPTVLFDATGAGAIVLSAASAFMGASSAVTGGGQALAFGALGSAREIPATHSHEFVLFFGASPNAAVMAWGAALLGKFGKAHDGSATDFTNAMLGYNTDHGAFYYYTTGNYKDYNEALSAVYEESVALAIPYKFVLLDSWWYFKGTGGGVKNWTAMPSVFEDGQDGVKKLVEQTGWKITAHNRWWSNNTDYSVKNGGDYLFFTDPPESAAGGIMALPLEERFWADLLQNTTAQWGGGLATYEQDWLYNELGGVDALLTNLTLGRQWILQMAGGAQAAGVTMQLCMAYPRHLLQSVEAPAITQVRASDDHVPPGTTAQWRMGYSSLFSWAVGVAPFKDNSWSTSDEPGGSCGRAHEPAPGLHLAISVFSNGPVTPGDGVGFQNVDQIMRTTRADGVVLHPSRAMTAIDADIVGRAFPSPAATTGPVYATYSVVAGAVYDSILAADLPQPFAVAPANLAGVRADLVLRDASRGALSERLAWRPAAAAEAAAAVAYSVNTSTMDLGSLVVQPFDAAHPVALRACGEPDFQVWHTAPVFANGWALLGELAKWVPVSPQRVAGVEASDSQLIVQLVGAPAEAVALTGYLGASAVTVRCVLDAAGRATAIFPDGTCA